MEKYISGFSLNQERLNSKKFGVAVFIFDGLGRVFTIKEKEGKASTGKKPNEYSVICETRELDEDWIQNTKRGLREELGIPTDQLAEIFDFQSAIVWETGFVDGAWATVVKLICKEPDLLMNSVGLEREPDMVEIVGWKTKDEFKSLQLRRGVGNILAKFENEIFQ